MRETTSSTGVSQRRVCSQMARLFGLNSVEGIDELEIDRHLRILALLRGPG
jgi:hypothetical protein